MRGKETASLASLPARLMVLPGLRQLRRSRCLNTLLRQGHGSRWGRFASRADAAIFLNSSRRISYDSPEIARVNIETFSQTHLFDWPVLFFLQRGIANGLRSIMDFGGHVGVKYLAFKQQIDLPDDLRWQVVDVPAICDDGRRRSAGKHGQLSFHEDVRDIASCELLLCSGVLQYSELSLVDLVARLPRRPTMIIVNKVGVVEGEGFFTLEDFGSGRMPYEVFTRDKLPDVLRSLGYDQIAAWSIPDRGFPAHSAQGTDWVEMVGGAWQVRTT